MDDDEAQAANAVSFRLNADGTYRASSAKVSPTTGRYITSNYSAQNSPDA